VDLQLKNGIYRLSYKVPPLKFEKGTNVLEIKVTALNDNSQSSTGTAKITNIDVSLPEFKGDILIVPNYVRFPEGDPYPKVLVNIEEPNSTVEVKIYDISGYLVKDFTKDIRNKKYAKGTYMITEEPWDLRNSRNEECPSGVYIFSVKINGKQASRKKLILIR